MYFTTLQSVISALYANVFSGNVVHVVLEYCNSSIFCVQFVSRGSDAPPPPTPSCPRLGNLIDNKEFSLNGIEIHES